ncbi:MAG: hypothetical protein JW850_23045 [Thermoflexales bacterium]|nr:hypothetical protein [Thermoflexales bacterium]
MVSPPMYYLKWIVSLAMLVGCQAQPTPQPTPSLPPAHVETMPPGLPWVHVEPAASQLKAGQSAPISVMVDNAQDLFGAELYLAYDPAVIEVQDEDTATQGVQVKVGDLLAADFVAFNQVEAGVIGIAFLQLPPRQPVTGTGQLIGLTVVGLAPGTTAITLGAKLADSAGNPISTNVTHGQLTVTQ